MKFSDLSIDESLKYLIAGGYTLFLFKFNSIEKIETLKDFELITTFVAFSIGAVEYFLFRTILYPGIQRLIDRYSAEMNARNYIKEKWGKTSAEFNWRLRNDVWAIYQNIDGVLSGKTYQLWKTSIIMLHVIGWVSIFYVPIRAYSNLVPNAKIFGGVEACGALFFLGFGLGLSLCAFWSETKLEIRLFRDVLKNQNVDDKDTLIKSIKFDKYLETNKETLTKTTNGKSA